MNICAGSTCNRRFSEWAKMGLFLVIWQELLRFYDAQKGIDWEWSALDSVIIKAPKGGMRPAEIRPIAGNREPSAIC